MSTGEHGRRRFLGWSVGAALATAGWSTADRVPSVEGHTALAVRRQQGHRYCAFVKFIQSLDPRQLAETLAEQGYDGAELTVRPGGYIQPEEAAKELPVVHRALKEAGVDVSIITTSINTVDSPHAQAILETAAELGIQHYRMGFCRYDLKKSIRPQLDPLRRQWEELAKWNEKIGITGFYQNHSGAIYVGSTFWDLLWLLDGIDRKHLGVIFDIRHACVDGGLSWPIYYDLIKSHIVALSFKDYRWDERKVVNVPLGEGNIDHQFFSRVAKDFPDALCSVHVEYLEQEGLEPNCDALKKDLQTLKSLLQKG